jgi:uncharacterized protein YjbI with pentapeptide repeats
MFKLKLLTSGLVISLLAVNSVAAEEDPETRLLETNKCVECDLKNAYLEEAKLRRADLTGANLYRANTVGYSNT